MLTFASCKKEIEESENPTIKSCTLISSSDSDGANVKLTYDVNGRITMHALVDGTYQSTHSYTYSSNQIIQKTVVKTQIYNVTFQETFILDNLGKVTSSKRFDGSDEYTTTYTYNSDGYLSTAITNGSLGVVNSIRYIWFDGNLSSYTSTAETITYEYSSQTMPKNFYHDDISLLPSEFVSPLRGYFGKGIKNLPSKWSTKTNSYVYTYSTDSNGNLITMGVKYGLSSSTLTNFEYSCK